MVLLEDLQGLELLHRDLLAQAELRLPNIERLWNQLEARIEEFRCLLDKAPRNEQSRKTLESGTGTQARNRLLGQRMTDHSHRQNKDRRRGIWCER